MSVFVTVGKFCFTLFSYETRIGKIHPYTVSKNLVLSAVSRIFQSFSQFPTLKGKELILCYTNQISLLTFLGTALKFVCSLCRLRERGMKNGAAIAI